MVHVFFRKRRREQCVAGFLVPRSSTYFFFNSVSGPELFGLVWSAVRTVSPVGIDFWDVQNSIREKGGKKSNTRGHKINKLETELQGNCHSTVIEKKTEKRQNQEHVKDLVIDLVDDYRKMD